MQQLLIKKKRNEVKNTEKNRESLYAFKQDEQLHRVNYTCGVH
jgi:hypothetical protein